MRTLISTFFVALFALITASCSAATEADRDELIAAYLNWRGGEAFESATSIVQEGTATTSGLTGPIQVIETRDGYSRTDITLDVFHVLEVLTPDGGWQLNPNGQAEDMGEATVTDARRALERSFALPLIAGGDDVTRLADENHDGTTWGVIRIAYDNGDYVDRFIEPETGTLGWTRNHQDTDDFWVRYDDWQEVDGVRLPGHTETLFDDPIQNVTIDWETAYVNAPIPPAAFEWLDGADRVAIAGGAASTGWIPIDYFRQQRIFLPATLNGYETQVILDSGAEMTVVDAGLARAAGLESVGSVQARGTGGTQEASFASGVDLIVGDLELHDLTVAIVDLSALAPRLGRALPIILGKEVFNETVVDIDYPNRRIAFHDPDQWSYEGVGARARLLEAEGGRTVSIAVEGGAPITVAFDIGQGAALTLFENYIDAAGLVDGRPMSDHLGGGVGGARVSPLGRVASLTFGGVTFHDVPTTFAIDAEGAFDTTREAGNLGTDIFNRFHMIVNYSADELILESDAAMLDTPFDTNTAGVQGAVTDEGLSISHVMASSPAFAAGLTDADVITAINGAAVTADYWEDDQWRWVYGDPHTEVMLSLADGRDMILTLVQFY